MSIWICGPVTAHKKDCSEFMKISRQSVEALASVITGNGNISPYRSGPKLVDFFNHFGFDLSYEGRGFPSRHIFAEERIEDLNNSSKLRQVISAALDLRDYINTSYNHEEVMAYLNEYLSFDGYQIIKQGRKYIVTIVKEGIVGLDCDPSELKGMSPEFVEEQVSKAKYKIELGDYSGAITNARSLLEGILMEIDFRFSGEKTKYDGDLVKLYRKVMKQLNLEPGRVDLSETLKQILSGLINIVNGIAGLRNKMSDAHASTYKPSEHHALLAVNAVNTLSSFLLASYSYQVGKGLIVRDCEENNS